MVRIKGYKFDFLKKTGDITEYFILGITFLPITYNYFQDFQIFYLSIFAALFLLYRLPPVTNYISSKDPQFHDFVGLLRAASLFVFYLYILFPISSYLNGTNTDISTFTEMSFLSAAISYPFLRAASTIESPSLQNRISLFIPLVAILVSIYIAPILSISIGYAASKIVSKLHIRS